MTRAYAALALAAVAALGTSAAADPVCFDSRVLLDHDTAYYAGCTEVKEQWEGGYCVQSHGTVAGRPYRVICVQ